MTEDVASQPIADEPPPTLAEVAMLTMPGGEAIVDTAAAQNIIGEEELADLLPYLEELGVEPVWLNEELWRPWCCGAAFLV